MTAIRVLLADDHHIIRYGLRRLLESTDDIEIVAEAHNGAEALQLVELTAPDVLLLDIEMPGMNGLEVAEYLHATESPVRILILSGHDSMEYVSDLFSLGVYGYLVKAEIPSILCEAIRGVARGEKGWVSRRVAARWCNQIRVEAPPVPLLSRRETQVLKLVVDGQSNHQISLNLGISQKTVEKHLGSIYSKCAVQSRVEAAVHAVRLGLV